MTTDKSVHGADDASPDNEAEDSQNGPAEPEKTSAEPTPHKKRDRVSHTRASGMWVGSIVAAIVMIFLLVFIIQNNDTVEIKFLAFSFDLPLGVALLLAAISAALVIAVPGAIRIMQLRRHLKS